MDIKRLILDKLLHCDTLISDVIVKETGFSRTMVNTAFQELIDEGKIIRFGKTKGAFYVRAEEDAIARVRATILEFTVTLKNEKLREDVILNRIKRETGIVMGLSENVLHIFEYAFTEIFNNAVDHSQSKHISVEVKRTKDDISFLIEDNGIGIFNNIRDKKQYPDVMYAIERLIKGKITTAPVYHSGEGIFFTSRIADSFSIQSFGKKLLFQNTINDVFIDDVTSKNGTRVFFIISLTSTKNLIALFDTYCNTESELYEFNKTEVNIKLFQFGDTMVSRSQAKRVMHGLEEFDEIMLDFKDVRMVGQGFADEVFRVWQNAYPQKNIVYRNANDNSVFMIERAKK